VRFVPIVDVVDAGAISGFDLHTMVGNALDNAIEAAAGVSERELREVRLSLRQVNRLLFMTVENRFAGELAREGERLLSTKPADDGRPHGYGLENIRRAAAGRGGSMDYLVDGDRFVLTAMVPLDERVGAK
jgi:sensor histidine kinase regulating citrate/malate metabolism